jgi:hypothetical protein
MKTFKTPKKRPIPIESPIVRTMSRGNQCRAWYGKCPKNPKTTNIIAKSIMKFIKALPIVMRGSVSLGKDIFFSMFALSVNTVKDRPSISEKSIHPTIPESM